MSFTLGGGGSAPKTTVGGLSFPTATTSTAVGSTNSGSGFSFGNALTSQPSSATPFSFGTPAATITTSATGSLFSATTTNQQPVVSSGGFLGTPASTSASNFSFAAPATTTASGGFTGFQLPTSTPAAAATPTLQFGGSSKTQGIAPEPAKSAAPTLQTSFFSTSKPAGTSLLTPTTTTTAAATTTSIAAPTLGFPSLLLGQTSAPSTTATTTTTALGLAAATTTTATSSLSTSTQILASLTTATSTSSAAGALTTSGVAAAAGGLSVAGLEEKVNKWMSELREQEERLMRQAAHVNAWDQLLQQGHDQVQQLRLTLNNVKTDQNRLQAELDFIQGQQQELEQLIEPLEAAATSTTPAQHPGDRQRENMHLVAQNLDSQLRQITDDLCKVIEHLNSSNSGSRASDPVNTVARVLSAHMDTLKWVDQNSALLSQKIDELSRSSDSKRRD